MKFSTTHLFTRLLQEGDTQSLRRVNPLIFVSENDRFIYESILEYTRKYYTIPSIEVIQDITNNIFVPSYPSEAYATEYIFDIVVNKLKKTYLQKTLTEAKDPYDPQVLADALDVCKIAESKTVIYADVDPDAYFTEQKALVPKFSAFITENITKIVGSDFLLFVGRMKNQKTHITRILLLDLLLQGYNGILFTNEITAMEYSQQLDALIAAIKYNVGFNPNVFREGNPSQEVKEALAKAQEYRATKLGQLMIVGAIRSTDEYQAAINRCEFPVDFIMVDGMHLMGGAAGTIGDKSQSLRNISNATKMFCIENQVPVIAVSQSNRARDGKANPDTTTIGLSDAFAQDATAVFDCSVQEIIDGSTGDVSTGCVVTPIVNRYGGLNQHVVFTAWNTMTIEITRRNIQNNNELDLEDGFGNKEDSGFGDPNATEEVTENENEVHEPEPA